MFVDFSIFFQRASEQLRLMLIMLEREAVQRQIGLILVILLGAWLAPKLVDAILKRFEKRPSGQSGATPAPPPSKLRTRVIRWLRALDFVLFPVLFLLLAQRAIHRFVENGWPYGLLDAFLPIFWLLLGYRFVIGMVLAALPEDKSQHFATEVLRPVVWILILLIARSILFSTLGIGEIALLTFADVTINLGDLLNAAISILLALLAGWAVRSVVARLMVRSGAEIDVANTVSNVTRYAVVSLGALIALGILGVDLGALAWIGGGLSVGLGFGLQELFGNFVSGIVLVFERIVRPGDIIEVQGLRGAVTKVAMRATVLKTADSIEIFVPNKELMTKPVLAMTYSDRMARVTLNIGVAYDSDLDVAERILLETVQRHPLVVSDPAPGVLVTTMDPYSIHYLAFGYVREFSSSFRVKSELYQMVRDAFALHKIVIPFPRQDIVLIGEEMHTAKAAQLLDPGKPPTH
ncbi:MAG: mechanosensitive ion channel domain-containing protein [Caldilinea sp.]